MENKFIQRIIVSLILTLLGVIEIILNSSVEFNYGYLNASIGGILLIISIISYIKYSNYRKEIDKELLKEHDERDDIIDGKVAKLTLRVLIFIIIIIMFISNWIVIKTNIALAIIMISFLITEFIFRKYYSSSI